MTQNIKALFKAKRADNKRRAANILPVVTGDSQCDDCWAMPGTEHSLSCEHVTIEQFRAYLGDAR